MSKKKDKSGKKKMDVVQEPKISENEKKVRKLTRIKDDFHKSREKEKRPTLKERLANLPSDEEYAKNFAENPLEPYARDFDMNPEELAKIIEKKGLTIEEYIEIREPYIFEKISLKERQEKWFLEMERKKEKIKNGEIFENNMTTAEEWRKFAKENPKKAYQEYYKIDDDYLMQIFLKKLKRNNKTITEHMYDRGWPIPNPRVQQNTKNFNNGVVR